MKPAPCILLATTLMLLNACDNSASNSNSDANLQNPKFSIGSGSYNAAQTVTLYTDNPNVAIYYSFFDTGVSSDTNKYTKPITVGSSTNIYAVSKISGKSSGTSCAKYRVSLTPWESSIQYDSLLDFRDGHMYRTVSINSQTWMAENLNYIGNSSVSLGVCYGLVTDSCAKYGRLYTWDEVANNEISTAQTMHGICPLKWHVPKDTEWLVLINSVESDSRVGVNNGGTALRSKLGWLMYTEQIGYGTDIFGFHALPAGDRLSRGTFYDIDIGTTWWSASSRVAGLAYNYALGNNYSGIQKNEHNTTIAYSLRCVKD